MSRIVLFDNWQEMLEQTIDLLFETAGRCNPGSLEQATLLEEIERLRQLKSNVRDVAPEARQCVDSFLIPNSTRTVLSIPAAIIQKVGELHDLYHRFRSKLTWSD